MGRHHVAIYLVIVALVAACGSGDDQSTSGGGTAGAAPTATQAAAPTSEPSDTTPRAGWRRHNGEGFSVDLPEQYLGGSPDGTSALEEIRALGGNCAGVAELIASVPEAFKFVAVDSRTCSGSVKSIQIVAFASSASSPTHLVEDFRPGLPDTAEFLNWSDQTIGERPAAVMLVRRNYPNAGFSTTQKVYGIKASGGWYLLSAAALPADFDAVEPEYDEIAATFHVE